jgi:hypothetical protein
MLPECRFRGEPFTLHGQTVYPCPHPIIRGAQPAAVVSAANCRDCIYVGFDDFGSKQRYRQQHDLQPTEEEFATRVDTCGGCDQRIDNYCPRAGGNCNLTQKLTKGEFCCPLSKFLAIERER